MSQNYQATELNTEDLIKKNLGLVKKIAWHLHGRVRGALEIEDLIQIGYTGLVIAANNFVSTVEARQGLKIACLEEISFKKGWINSTQLEEIATKMQDNPYKGYLLGLLDG